MKNTIFALILPAFAFGGNDPYFPGAHTPPTTPRQPTPVTARDNASAHQTPQSTGSDSFFRNVESEYGDDDGALSPVPPPLPFSQHTETIQALMSGIVQAVDTEHPNIIALITHINELALYHAHYPNTQQSQLLLQIANESNSWRRGMAIVNFLNNIFSLNNPIRNRINSSSFRLQVIQEHHMLDAIEDELRQLERAEDVSFQAFWELSSLIIPRADYISDENERNLLRALQNQTREVLWQGLFIAWLESRYVTRDVIDAFRANLRETIRQFQEHDTENPAALRTLAAEARTVGFEDLAQELESSARWSENLQETVRQGPSLFLRVDSATL